MRAAGLGPIDDDLSRFMQGPVSVIVATTDSTNFPDATRVSGLVAVDDRRLRVLISADATTTRANAVPGARAAVLVTDILSYRSVAFKGSVVDAASERSPGDVALVDHHVTTFLAAAPDVGLVPAMAERLFATEVVPLVVEVDTLFDQTPGPGAGRGLGVRR